MLAVAYDEFSLNAKFKFKKLFVHRRTAIAKSLSLLSSQHDPNSVTFQSFFGVVTSLKPGISKLRCYLMFKTLDNNRAGVLDLCEFYKIYDCLELNWYQVWPDVRWYDGCWLTKCCEPIYSLLALMTRVAESVWLERCVTSTIFISLVYEIIKTSGALKVLLNIDNDHVHSLFITFYGLEAIVKLIGLGPVEYSTSGWNPFDFIVMIVSATGQVRIRNYFNG